MNLSTTLRTLCVLTLLSGQVMAAKPTRGDLAFEKLVDLHWKQTLTASPFLAASLGDKDSANQLPDVSILQQVKRAQDSNKLLSKLNEIQPSKLSPTNQTNWAILRRLLIDGGLEFKYRTYLIPISNRSGFHMQFAEMHKSVPFQNAQDYRNYIDRLDKFGTYTDQHIELLTEGISTGNVLPSVVLRGYEDTITAHIVRDPTNSLLYAPFRSFPEGLSAAEEDQLRAQAMGSITNTVVPAYKRFSEFMQKTYIPAARGTIGASALPNGREFYRFRVRHFTTLEISPDEVHQLGLTEVARIKSEMLKIIGQVEFDGDFAEFLLFLRTDARFYPTDANEYLKETAYILKRMDGELPKLFLNLPRNPYGLKVIPAYIAPKTTTAYYQPPPASGKLAGQYFLNTYNLKSRPLYELEALSLHEAVPGHHLQIALQQELVELPSFRKYSGFTAFVEGWALYAERLGLEVGFYKDPYNNFGRLSYEMWRACRLVVDTGIHYQGWTRERAIDYMIQNTSLSQHNIVAEVDRYIAWPGQALAYKMGELKIRELREKAAIQLGARFDIREFHDAVLRYGAVPLPILETNINKFIEEKTP
ncbi:MAG: DUF885 domain-containing protein [Planctomycetaceae bacterium]|nr:DUF885 domain-containing protein [Planctomycetaceae bacterium]MBT5124357.1 DUF885 domain-containing protein [Planctomycetaceae bacterium]MBT6847343.1 DUF885 domain-containing protein [Planctomycetaceae bacterium]MBT7256939.1 DUF885 domain-containing protein [Planctomycetaceae bacterium]